MRKSNCTQKNAYSRFFHTVISGYRYYDANMGRWINRDPKDEFGFKTQTGINRHGFEPLYVMVGNDAINKWDYLGLWVDLEQIISPKLSVFQVGGHQLTIDILLNNATRGNLLRTWRNAILLPYLAYKYFPGAQGRGSNAFVFTCKYGWVDKGHFFNSAIAGYLTNEKIAYLSGYLMEIGQFAFLVKGIEGGWAESSFTPEDLPSDYQGSRFGVGLQKSDDKIIQSLKNDPFAYQVIQMTSVKMKWKKFLQSAGAVAHNGDAKNILQQDVKEWKGEMAFTLRMADNYKKKHTAYKCLCNGNKPKDEYKY